MKRLSVLVSKAYNVTDSTFHKVSFCTYAYITMMIVNDAEQKKKLAGAVASFSKSHNIKHNDTFPTSPQPLPHPIVVGTEIRKFGSWLCKLIRLQTVPLNHKFDSFIVRYSPVSFWSLSRIGWSYGGKFYISKLVGLRLHRTAALKILSHFSSVFI